MTDDELRQLIASNARAIEALGETVRENSHASQRSIENLERVVGSFAAQVSAFTSQTAEAMQQAQTEREEFRQAMMGIANLVSSLDSVALSPNDS